MLMKHSEAELFTGNKISLYSKADQPRIGHTDFDPIVIIIIIINEND